jgi:hypothetical protein
MDDPRSVEEQVLVRELGRLGAAGGAAGGAIGGGRAGRVGGRRGGRSGAELAAKRIRTDRCELTVECDMSPDEVLRAASGLLAGMGRLLDDVPPSAARDEVWALVGGGAGGLNPVVVRVAADRLGDAGCRAVVRACAKEGLIKQRAAQKTAARVRDALVGRGDDRKGRVDL